MTQLAAGTMRDIRVTGLISFGHMLSHFYFLVLPPIMPLLRSDLGVSYTALGALMSGFALAAAVAQTPVGFLVDRVGARVVVVAGLFLEGLCIALMGFANGYWMLMALYVTAGVANSVFHPGDYAIMVASISKERLGRAFSVHLFSGNVGFALAPVVMGGIAVLWDWRAALVIMGCVGMVWAVVMWTQASVLDDDVRAREARESRREERKPADEAPAAGVRLLLSVPILMCLAFFIMMTLGFSAIKSFFVVATGVLYDTPLATANAALTGFMLASAVGVLAGGVLADRFGARIGTAVVTLTAAGATVLLVGSVPLGAVVLVSVMAASGFLQGLLMPTRDLLVRAVTPDGSMGKVMGFLSSGMMLASGLVPIVYGWVLDNTDARWIFWLSALFITAALLTFSTARGRPGAAGQRGKVPSAAE
jgi:MFS transporter, FSR family, fosmidomycin resistance protein